jgi:hypothetical protein
MQRIDQRHQIGFKDHQELNRLTAFHVAGYVAAMYLENQRKNLPLIYFQILIGKQESKTRLIFAKVSGGRLVGDLGTITPEKLTEYWNSASSGGQGVYEADIVNFLSGSLAEAKYVAIRDNESFCLELLNPDAVINYGGQDDMQEVNRYLDFFVSNPQRRTAKLKELFGEAYRFVEQESNWKSIAALAHYILENNQGNISCEQAIEVLAPSEGIQISTSDLILVQAHSA